MNNNCLPISQNIYNSRIEYPIQISQNLNYLFYLMPDKSSLCVPNISFYPIYPLPFLQDKSQQQVLMNIYNDKNQIPVFCNYAYNNIYSPLNTMQFNNSIAPTANSQLNFGSNIQVPPPHDPHYLNKKRSSTVLYEKENEKINVKVKTEEEVLQIKDTQNITNLNTLQNNETKMISDEENIIKNNSSEKKNEMKNEENEKEKIVITPICNETKKEDKEEKKVEKKKTKKKKRNCAEELLQDTLLQHIGESKKDINIVEHESPKEKTKINVNKSDIKNKNKSKSNKSKTTISTINKLIDIDEKSTDNTENKENKEKNKKIKIKNTKNQKKKQHKLTIKKNNDILADLQKDKPNEKNESNSKLTKVIFHGDNYEKTKSVIDFMKYNFDFSIEEQYKTKKLITDYDQQHADFTKMNENFYENYNSNSQNIDNIEQKWSREKFSGDNKELKKVINIISDTFPGRKSYTNEEKYLSILKNNDYNIEEFLNSKNTN